MKRRKNNRFKFILLLVIALGVVGYAALRTTLTINGQTTIAKNNWSVKFTTITPVQNDGTITSTPVVTGDTTFSFGVKLNTPGDIYQVKVKVENQGSIDAMLSANATLSGLEDMADYVEYSATYKDGIAVEAGNLLAKNSEDEILVTIKFKDDIDAEDLADLASADVTRTLTFSMTYVQADSTASEREKNAITYLKRQVAGQITPGDIIGIGETEDFYVIASDSTKTVLLAKYNLFVGYNYNEYTNYEDMYIAPSKPGYGLQNVDAYGYDGTYIYATVAFSNTNYWMNGNDLISLYSENDTIYYDSNNWQFKYRSDDSQAYPYVYNSSLTAAPGFSPECEVDCFNKPGYSIAYYVEEYKTKLIEMGAPSTITGRLLSYEEAIAMQSIKDNGTSIIFGVSHYWLGSACTKNSMCTATPSGEYYKQFEDPSSYGVRPVIEIPTSELQ